MIVGLALVCFPLVASAPEPVLHCKNGGGLPVEEHGVASSPEPVRHCMNSSGRPVEEHGAGARVHVDLALVCIPLVASAPEPVLHSLNGSDGPVEEPAPETAAAYLTSCP